MKVLGIGLPRTGTTSLNKALQILGYDSVHTPLTYDEMVKHEAATDSPGALWYRRVYEAYPECKFIHTVRQVDSWLTSIGNDFGKPARPKYRHFRMLLFGRELFDRVIWATVFRLHWNEVDNFSEIHEDAQILSLNICAGDGWKPLCKFLDKPVPDAEFPWENRFRAI